MRHPMSKLLMAAAAAGTVCALAAAGTAAAAPPPAWYKSAPAIPNVFTNTTPALGAFYQNAVAGTFFAWKGQLSNDVYYRYKINGHWSPVRAIPGAHTNSGPAAAFYTNFQGKPSEFVAWKALHSNTIFYATGLIGTAKNSALSWTSPVTIALKGDKLAQSSSGPSVIFPINSPNGRVIISWRGPGHHVRYELGAESGKNDRHFTFDLSQWISGGTALDSTLTSGTPALAEQNGVVYVFWKADGSGKGISYASTPDNTGLAGNKTIPWTLLGAVPGAFSTAPPTASDISPHDNTTLMLAYKGPGADYIRYQLFSGSSWSAVAYVTGHNNTTTIGPALLNTTLASVSPTTSGTIYLHTYRG
jgi:hypothetical protein